MIPDKTQYDIVAQMMIDAVSHDNVGIAVMGATGAEGFTTCTRMVSYSSAPSTAETPACVLSLRSPPSCITLEELISTSLSCRIVAVSCLLPLHPMSSFVGVGAGPRSRAGAGARISNFLLPAHHSSKRSRSSQMLFPLVL